jgi:hypothetical protein
MGSTAARQRSVLLDQIDLYKAIGDAERQHGYKAKSPSIPTRVVLEVHLQCWIKKSNIGLVEDKVSNGSDLPRVGWRGKLEEVILISSCNSLLAVIVWSSKVSVSCNVVV